MTHLAAAFAPAKVNLFLHVGETDAEGMHPLCSLMAFADVGDRLWIEPGQAPEPLRITGPFAEGLSASGDNLVVRAARAVLASPGPAPRDFQIVLDKQLPIASGLGGGSSDAGAALRLLREAFRPALSDDELAAMAASLGSDGAACLFGRPVIAERRGERLSIAPVLPTVFAVLANPGVPSPTGAVYRQFDQMVGGKDISRPSLPDAFESVEALVEVLAALRNDLEAPAVALNPLIGEALDQLGRGPGSLLTRVSGSGATCFAVCADRAASEDLAARIGAARPGWWVRSCRIGGPWA